jgi:hypothetical protein
MDNIPDVEPETTDPQPPILDDGKAPSKGEREREDDENEVKPSAGLPKKAKLDRREKGFNGIKYGLKRNKARGITYSKDEEVTAMDANLRYVIRTHIPIEVLFNILDQICTKKDKYYLMNFNAFRLLQFHGLYPDFAAAIVDCYRPSKQYFVTRTLSYNSFMTIIRQICRINKKRYEMRFNYQHSVYNIDYYIYYEEAGEGELRSP